MCIGAGKNNGVWPNLASQSRCAMMLENMTHASMSHERLDILLSTYTDNDRIEAKSMLCVGGLRGNEIALSIDKEQ